MITEPKYQMIPYQREDRDIYVGLDFDPGEPEPKPEAMYQELPLREFLYLLYDRFVVLSGRTDVFISGVGFVCYDRSNLNVRVGPTASRASARTPAPSAAAGSTCPGRRARRPTSPWKWPRKAPLKTA